MIEIQTLQRWKLTTLLGIVLANIAFVLAVIAWDWPQWWVNINYERSALTWFSSVQMLCIGLAAWMAAFLSEVRPESKPYPSWIWHVMGLGFVFASMDERFQFHERIRANLLIPHQIGTHLPGISAGNIVLLGYAVVGLALTVPLFRRLSGPSRRWFLAAVLVAAIAVGMDAIDLDAYSNQVQRIEQFWEEIFETVSQMCFLLAFVRQDWQLMEELHATKDRSDGSPRP